MKSLALAACTAVGCLAGTVATAAPAPEWSLQLSVIDVFAPGFGVFHGVGYDRVTQRVWVASSFDDFLLAYDRLGASLGSITQPGEVSNDGDVDFSPTAVNMAGQTFGAGTMLYINGESGPAEIYAVNPADGQVLATLFTTVGNGSVVGGAYHPQRGTFFLVDYAADDVSEVDAQTGATLNTFDLTGIYNVHYGDLDISQRTGNLYLVSSASNDIAEVTPEGTLLQTIALPLGVTAVSGIGIDDKRGQIWLSNTSGSYYQVKVNVVP